MRWDVTPLTSDKGREVTSRLAAHGLRLFHADGNRSERLLVRRGLQGEEIGRFANLAEVEQLLRERLEAQ